MLADCALHAPPARGNRSGTAAGREYNDGDIPGLLVTDPAGATGILPVFFGPWLELVRVRTSPVWARLEQRIHS